MSLVYLQQESTPIHPDSIWALNWTAANRLVSGCSDGHLRIYDPLDLSFPTHDIAVLPLAVSSLSSTADGRWGLATSLDGTVALVDLLKGNEVGKVETGREKVGAGESEIPSFSSAIHPSGACWAWSGRSSKLAIRPISSLPSTTSEHDTQTESEPLASSSSNPLKGEGKVVETSKGKFGLDVKFSPDGRQIAIATESGHIIIVDTETQTIVSDYASHAMPARTASWSADSQWLFSGSDDHRIVLHDVRAGSTTGSGGKGEGAVGIMHGHQSWVLSVDSSPDGKLLGSGGADALVKLWDVGQRNCVSTIQADAEVWNFAWQSQSAASSVSGGPAAGKQFAIAGDDKVVTLYRAAGSV